MRTIHLSMFVAAVLGAAGCTMIGEAPASRWYPTPPLTQPRKQYMPAMISVTERAGFTIETKDETLGTLMSQWRVSLRPQWRQGFRERVHMRIEETAKREPIINVQVEKERNENSSRPMAAEKAEWVSWGSNDPLSEKLAFDLRLKLDKPKFDD
jgi:hypothetical protein